MKANFQGIEYDHQDVSLVRCLGCGEIVFVVRGRALDLDPVVEGYHKSHLCPVVEPPIPKRVTSLQYQRAYDEILAAHRTELGIESWATVKKIAARKGIRLDELKAILHQELEQVTGGTFEDWQWKLAYQRDNYRKFKQRKKHERTSKEIQKEI